MQQFAG